MTRQGGLNLQHILLSIFVLCFATTSGIRNAEAEENCRKFLINPDTAPIVRKSTRDLDEDKISEDWCQLVLKDDELPAQIRSTVMEGLAVLFLEHTRLNIADRRAEAYAMQKALVMQFPDVARFLLFAARYAIEVMGEPQEAHAAISARIGDLQQNTDEEKDEVAQIQGLLDWLEKNQSNDTKDGFSVGERTGEITEAVNDALKKNSEAKPTSEKDDIDNDIKSAEAEL